MWQPRTETEVQRRTLYCDICDVHNVSLQTYQAHMSGQKHAKKVQAAKTSPVVISGGPQALFCELCNVSCSSQAVLTIHINAARHRKVVSEMKERGLTVPDIYDPPPPPPPEQQPQPIVTSNTATGSSRKPKIKFKSKTTTSTTDEKMNTELTDDGATPAAADDDDNAGTETLMGAEYIETLTTDSGSIVSYHCKLCECSFTDAAARIQHLTGRRHLIMYKRKVDSSVKINVKPTSRQAYVRNLKTSRRLNREQHWHHMDMMAANAQEQFHAAQYQFYRHPAPYWPQRQPGFSHQWPTGDQYMLKKHDSILLKHADVASLELIVSLCEQTLSVITQQLSDEMSGGGQTPVANGDGSGTEAGKEKTVTDDKSQPAAVRVLLGVIRVGPFVKRLLLDGDVVAELVVMCAEKPTTTLLRRVATLMATEMAKPAPEREVKYVVAMDCDETSIVVYQDESPHWTVTISLTCPAVRQPLDEGVSTSTTAMDTEADPVDVLDRQKCLDALAAVRHAKWFHARCHSSLCVLVNRVLRDLRRRDPVWSPLNDWAQELIVEKCMCYVGYHAGPANVLRSVFECIGSGILLPGGAGILDPCEKEPVDAADNLTPQQREDLTLAAQTASRLMSLHQIHTVLGMSRLSNKELWSRPRPTSDKTSSAAAAGDETEKTETSAQSGEVESESKKPKLDSSAAAADAAMVAK